MIAYKVVGIECSLGQQHTSCYANRDSRVIYRTDKYSKAPLWLRKVGYHLFAFDTKQNAEKFCDRHKGYVGGVWECDVLYPILPVPKIILVASFLDKKKLLSRINDWSRVPAPIGTIMAKQIKLLNKV